MKKSFSLFIFTSLLISVTAQTYFPPKFDPAWDTLNPQSLGWCTDKLDTLEDFLQTHNTKGFIILKDGKIVWEKYFGTFTQDSLWYWASAGKSLFSFLAGQAQEQGFFMLDDTVSTYLGAGWTSCTLAQEEKILVHHLLSMTSGLKDDVPNPNCLQPSCLVFEADAGTRWAYHNAPYTLSHQVLESATGQTLQQFTTQNLLLKSGMLGGWFTDTQSNEIFASRVRDMARFGLLMQNNGVWAGDTLLADTAYFNDMISSSQQSNRSYGYLWWLNGKQSYMLPQSQLIFPSSLIPNAPTDTWCALGKNDQKLYVSQSNSLVVVRLGKDAGNAGLAPTIFDNMLWEELNKVFCTNVGFSNLKVETDPLISTALGTITVKTPLGSIVALYTLHGQKVYATQQYETETVLTVKPGVYVLIAEANGKAPYRTKVIVP